MGTNITISGEEAVRLATELAGLHHESVEAAVSRALRDTLERDRAAEAGQAEWAEQEYRALRAIVDDIHRLLRDPLPASNHDYLYDDQTGLPR